VVGEEKKFDFLASLARRKRLVPFLVAGMLWLNLLFFMDYREGIKRGYTDFSIFYTAGTILRQGMGHHLYDLRIQLQVQEGYAGKIPFRHGPLPYLHPPFEALIFVPLSLLSYARAIALWNVLSVGMLCGVAWLLRRSVNSLRSLPAWAFVLCSLSFFPVFVCLFQGQDSILQLLICTLAFGAMKKNSDVVGGGWLALAAFKFQFTVPMVLLFLVWKRRRVAVGFAAVATVLLLISAALVGAKQLLGYPEFILRVVNAQALGGVPLSLLPNLHGLARGWPGPFSGMFGIVLGALSSILLLLFAGVKGRAPRGGNFELQFAMAIVVSGLSAWQTNAHDLSLLVIAIAVVADYGLRGSGRGEKPSLELLHPILPLLFSPLWMVLWLIVGKVNLVAVFLLWWVWRIGGEMTQNAELIPSPNN
jgi:hypothetical protein